MTGQQIAVRPPVVETQHSVALVNPTSGEILNLESASVADIAGWRAEIKVWEASVRLAKHFADQEIVRRMDALNSHTIHEGGFKVSAPAAEDKTEYDAERLHSLLSGLAADPEINLHQDAVDQAVEQIVVFKPRARKIAGLYKRGGEIADVIDACTTRVPVDRRVKIERA